MLSYGQVAQRLAEGWNGRCDPEHLLLDDGTGGTPGATVGSGAWKPGNLADTAIDNGTVVRSWLLSSSHPS